RSLRVHLGRLHHAVFFEAARDDLGVLAELVALAGHAAVAGAGDNERERPVRMPQAEVERREAAHREAAHVGLLDLQAVEHAADVLGRALLRVRLHVVGHVRGRIAARVERDRAIAAREESHLQVPAPVVAGELVHEDQRQALPRLLVADLLAVLVLEQDRRGEGDAVARGGRLDDLGGADLALELGDAALDERLLLARRVVFRVLGEVAVRPRLGDGLDDGVPIFVLQAVELVAQALEPRARHRRALDRHGPLTYHGPAGARRGPLGA